MDCQFGGILAKISRLGAFYSLYPGPFTNLPGDAPVGLPLESTAFPFTQTSETPVAY